MLSRDPRKAAKISAREPMTIPRLRKKIMVSATVSFAPDEIPRTKGPTIGFPKNVCSRKPATAKAPPRSAAVKRRGRRIFQMMPVAVSPAAGWNRAFSTVLIPIRELPIMQFKTSSTSRQMPKAIKQVVYRILLFSKTRTFLLSISVYAETSVDRTPLCR